MTEYKSVAILGANSQMALDYIDLESIRGRGNLYLFSRMENIERLKNIIGRGVKSLPYSEFQNHRFDLIINFIGSSDQIKVRELGKKYLEICKKFDDMVLDYLHINKDCQYIFISSGASYGQIFERGPANENSKSTFSTFNNSTDDFYGLTKYLIEKEHSDQQDLNIVDLRVFSYIDKNLNINSSMFVPSLARAIIKKEVFETSNNDMFRDYSCAEDIYAFIDGLKPSSMGVYDLISTKKISKFELLEALKGSVDVKFVNCSYYGGGKKYYYSESNSAEKIGFKPKYSSMDNILRYIKLVAK
jgi:nucleoside-diphosphate-sugar epimerase